MCVLGTPLTVVSGAFAAFLCIPLAAAQQLRTVADDAPADSATIQAAADFAADG